MRGCFNCFNDQHETKLCLRIGTASGPLVAGVIGRHRVQFDIWGVSVNLASRIEQSCESNRVSICETTQGLVAQSFTFEDRGLVSLKGVGPMRLFYLQT
jgi:adenylate cyclase